MRVCTFDEGGLEVGRPDDFALAFNGLPALPAGDDGVNGVGGARGGGGGDVVTDVVRGRDAHVLAWRRGGHDGDGRTARTAGSRRWAVCWAQDAVRCAAEGGK